MGMEMSAYEFKGRVNHGRRVLEHAPLDAFKDNKIVCPEWYDGNPTFRLTSDIRSIIVNILGLSIYEGSLYFNKEQIEEAYTTLLCGGHLYAFHKSEEEFLRYSALVDFFKICKEEGYEVAAG